MEDAIVLTYDISADDFTRAGEASSHVKRKLKQIKKYTVDHNVFLIFEQNKTGVC